MNIKPQESLVTCPCMRLFETGVAINVNGVDLSLEFGPEVVEHMRRKQAAGLEEMVKEITVAAAKAIGGSTVPWCPAGTAQIMARVFGRTLAGCTAPLPPNMAKGSTLNGTMTEEMWQELNEVARAEFDRALLNINRAEGRPNG